MVSSGSNSSTSVDLNKAPRHRGSLRHMVSSKETFSNNRGARKRPPPETENIVDNVAEHIRTSFYDRPSIKSIARYLDTSWWTSVVSFFTLILLFGPSIRDLFCPKESDIYFDVIFFITFLVLDVDIFLNCLANPRYFDWTFACNSSKWISIGSTMFWCDLLSTLVLLPDISFIFRGSFDVVQLVINLPLTNDRIVLSTFGNSFVRIKVILIKTTMRAARICRIMRQFSVKHASQWDWRSFCSELTFFNDLFRDTSQIRYSNSIPKKVRHAAAYTIQRWWRRQMKKSGVGKLLSLVPELNEDDSKNRQAQWKAPKLRELNSQVGGAMRDITANRIYIFILCAFFVTIIFSFGDFDRTVPLSMMVLHSQVQISNNEALIDLSVDAAKKSSLPNLYQYYKSFNADPITFDDFELDIATVRDREKLNVTIISWVTFSDLENTLFIEQTTSGIFINRDSFRADKLVELVATLFLLIIWLFGVMAFVGPIMILVVVPIERMIRLLGMLMEDPLGYQDTSTFSKFMKEEDELAKKSNWKKDVLKGMETSFLMSTILRIGSLMKVGFGSAGVEIIRTHLMEKGDKKNIMFSSQAGSTVSCIFLFCDIRQFTDATECLQEEVFVFTNKIAAVVHSICTAYGGSANKNIGDAFLLSWRLDALTADKYKRANCVFDKIRRGTQADKALLSVVKINIALHHDNYFLEGMSEKVKNRLLAKLATRSGPVVQLGFGLHAGKAVQGAIGTQRKLDPTYLSEAVEFTETLESNTKRYQVRVLMSDSFHLELNSENRRRCRKIDQVQVGKNGKIMDLYTFDMDIDAKWSSDNATLDTSKKKDRRSSEPMRPKNRSFLKSNSNRDTPIRRSSFAQKVMGSSPPVIAEDVEEDFNIEDDENEGLDESQHTTKIPNNLVLPTEPLLYNEGVWFTKTMKKIRHRANDQELMKNFDSGLAKYFSGNWSESKTYFQSILSKFEDGPSRLIMNEIEKYNGVPPEDFRGYHDFD